MNIYRKYCPNVFVAECDQEYNKGDEITVVTKYGKENEHIVHNLVKKHNGKFYYSITRSDGFNSQERAKNKVEKLNGYADKAKSRSNNLFDGNKEERKFLSLGEPIKVGHHSEKKHRALIEKNNRRMDKAVQESQKADEYRARVDYWGSMADKIDLSMPESIDYFIVQLEKAERRHAGLLDGSIKREHSYSLTYAKKKCNEMKKNLDTALELWG